MNFLQNRNRFMDIENRLIFTKGDSWGWGREINKYTLLYIKYVNEDLLHSTRNYTQYLIIIITYSEKEYVYLFGYVCVCVTESFCYIPET